MKILKQYKQHFYFILWVGLGLLLYGISERFYYRVDLTAEGRYSLSENTKQFLEYLTTDYEADIYLSGELPYGFYELQQAAVEIIKELDRESNQHISFSIVDVDTQNPDKVRQLSERGLNYTSVNIKDKEGRLTQQLLFPAVVLHNKEKEVVIPLLKNNPALSGQENLNQSIAALEYEFMNGLRMLERKALPIVAFLTGQGELNAAQTLDFTQSLSENYEVKRLEAKQLDGKVAALIIAQPRKDFSEDSKFFIDQYIMNGGKVLWLIDEVEISKDSLRNKQMAMAFYRPLNIEDQLFTYGVRINPKIALDMNGDLLKVNTALRGEQPRFTPLPWAYEPLLEVNPYHSITKGLAPVRGVFVNSLDTLEYPKKVEKTPLLRTSSATRLEGVPRRVLMKEIRMMQRVDFYPHSNTTVGVLLEGVFPSVFKGRLAYNRRKNFKESSKPTKMVVLADGDLIKNETRGVGTSMQFLPLGYNSDYKYLHGNKAFLLNVIDYLCDEEGWMELRNKEYTPAVLDKTKARVERSFWQWLNVAVPLIITFLVGIIYAIYRRRRYGK